MLRGMKAANEPKIHTHTLIFHVIFGERLIVTVYSPDGIYTAPTLQTTLVIAARMDVTLAILMSVKMYSSLLKYGQFNCVPNPFPASAFPLIRSGGLFFSSRSLLRPHTLTYTHLLSLPVDSTWS